MSFSEIGDCAAVSPTFSSSGLQDKRLVPRAFPNLRCSQLHPNFSRHPSEPKNRHHVWSASRLHRLCRPDPRGILSRVSVGLDVTLKPPVVSFVSLRSMGLSKLTVTCSDRSRASAPPNWVQLPSRVSRKPHRTTSPLRDRMSALTL
jgi:hypothetical protein